MVNIICRIRISIAFRLSDLVKLVTLATIVAIISAIIIMVILLLLSLLFGPPSTRHAEDSADGKGKLEFATEAPGMCLVIFESQCIPARLAAIRIRQHLFRYTGALCRSSARR